MVIPTVPYLSHVFRISHRVPHFPGHLPGIQKYVHVYTVENNNETKQALTVQNTTWLSAVGRSRGAIVKTTVHSRPPYTMQSNRT